MTFLEANEIPFVKNGGYSKRQAWSASAKLRRMVTAALMKAKDFVESWIALSKQEL